MEAWRRAKSARVAPVLARGVLVLPVRVAPVAAVGIGDWLRVSRGLLRGGAAPAARPWRPDDQPQDQAHDPDAHQDVADGVDIEAMRAHGLLREPQDGAHRDKHQGCADRHDIPSKTLYPNVLRAPSVTHNPLSHARDGHVVANWFGICGEGNRMYRFHDGDIRTRASRNLAGRGGDMGAAEPASALRRSLPAVP